MLLRGVISKINCLVEAGENLGERRMEKMKKQICDLPENVIMDVGVWQ